MVKQQYISDTYLQLFTICNSAQNWWSKRSFYRLKTKILHQYGIANGYDLQIIKQKCWSCNGTGVFRTKEACTSCENGIYSTRRVALKRWILNNKIFHEPIGHVLFNGNILPFDSCEIIDCVSAGIFYLKEINGLIKHEKESELNPHYCYLVLLHKYDSPKFYQELDFFISTCRTRTKNQIKKYLKEYGNLEGLAKFFQIKESFSHLII